jgi:hypothetical protein
VPAVIEDCIFKFGEEPPTDEAPVSETRRYKYHLIDTVPYFVITFSIVLFITNILAIIPKQKAISEKQMLSNVVNFVV